MLARAEDYRLRLERDGADWPNRDASRFVEVGGLRWHVQLMGAGPTLLLVHGAGAATHSWRALMPLLARRFRVIAPDLPGHGFSDPLKARELSLPGMARALGALLRAMDVSPRVVVGHSAGAATGGDAAAWFVVAGTAEGATAGGAAGTGAAGG